jgi:large subunit ribosomal protein L23
MNLDHYKIIRRPIITEKGSSLKEDNNQLVFEVDPAATKCEIRKAVQQIFKVTVLDVRTQNRMGKRKRMGRTLGRKKNWKKAIITLKAGDRVDFFEGV